jgi:general secretion pathway protein G
MAARDARGFSMLELLSVLVIVGVLTAHLVAGYRSAILRAKATATVQELTTIRIGLLLFEADCGGLPSWTQPGGDPGLCYAPTYAVGRWHGPYLRSWPATTPLGGRVVYMGQGGTSDVEPPLLRVDGLSAEKARLLGGMAANAFGPAGRAGRGGTSFDRGSVTSIVGTPGNVAGGSPAAETERRVGGGH